MNGAAARRLAYAAAVVLDLALLVILNVVPGWRSFDLVTADAAQVVELVNVMLAFAVVANAVSALVDRRWVRSSGNLVTLTMALVVLLRVWEVFPFDLTRLSPSLSPVDWEFVVRMVVAQVAFGCLVAVVVQVVALSTVILEAGAAPDRAAPDQAARDHTESARSGPASGAPGG